MWILYAAASAVCAGVTTIFLKKGVHTTNTNVALALRRACIKFCVNCLISVFYLKSI